MSSLASLQRPKSLSGVRPHASAPSRQRIRVRPDSRPPELSAALESMLAKHERDRPPVAGQAIYPTLEAARMAAREALWIDAEASSLLGGIGRSDEWTLTIYKEGSSPNDKYGFTPPEPGGDGMAAVGPTNGGSIAKAIGKPWSQSRSFTESVHTHPAGARGKARYRTEKFSPIDKPALRQGAVEGDRMVVLYEGRDLALITPSGDYIVGSSTLTHPLRAIDPTWKKANYPNLADEQVLPKWLEYVANADIATDDKVQLDQKLWGNEDGSEWRPPRTNLHTVIWDRVIALAKRRFPNPKQQARRLAKAEKKFAKRSAKGLYG